MLLIYHREFKKMFDQMFKPDMCYEMQEVLSNQF